MNKNNFIFYLSFAALWSNPSKSNGAEVNSYAGQSVDSATGLSHNRARFYDPECGSFISKDPIGVYGGLNQYEYCLSNPINYSDPTGLEFWTSVFGGVKMIGGVFEMAAGYSLATAGLATSATGVGALGVPAGILVGAHGIDTTQSGYFQMISGERVDSFTSLGLQKAGVSQNSANMIDGGIGIVGGGAAGIYTSASKVTTMSRLPEAAGMTPLQILNAADKGAKAVPNVVFNSLGGATTSTLQKAENIESVAGSGLHLGKALWLFVKGTGLTAKADLVSGVGSVTLLGANNLYNYFTQSGVLIDKAATLIESNLADIKGATYDPVSKQIIFLGSNTTPGVDGIDMDYFYTAVKSVYGSIN